MLGTVQLLLCDLVIGHPRTCEVYRRFLVNSAGAGPPRPPPAAEVGHKVAPLYFYDDIFATRRDREAKLRTHLPEYLAKVVSKFGVDPI